MVQFHINLPSPARGKPNGAVSLLHENAVIDARRCSTDYLLSEADWLQFELADADPAFPGEVGRVLASEHAQATSSQSTQAGAA